MSGYTGDLSDKQQHSLDELKYRLRDFWNEEFTDPFLLRWLRARDFDVNKSEKLLRDNILWRQRENIDSIIETYENPEVLRLYFPGGQCNRDREGRPFWLIRFGNADFKGMLQCVSKEALVKHVTYIVEKIIADMKAQSKKLGKLVDTITVVFDFDNFGIRQVYSHQVVEFVYLIMELYESYYPEMLEQCFVINVPSFFKIFWKFIRPFLTERTAGKIQIFSREGWQPVLLKCVDPSQLPAHWGGDLVGPDGDRECTHLVPAGGEVPVNFYLKSDPRVSEDPSATTCFLERGQKMDVPVKVDSEGLTLSWKFQTSPGHDVGFGVLHISGEHAEPKEVLGVSKVKCDQVAENGRLSAEPGTYIFRFDNSYSWFSKKQLSYVFQVKSSDEVLAPGS
ncbi:SEC14-like protein 2 [Ixodes scapularis]|uniref:SEC14-like protein 2 n=1 Tax=Ixodes scapularis TaxID=6945 RepID=UPI001A9DEEBF|nr:SEC14-like protein 2 [Ixodes scapularis]